MSAVVCGKRRSFFDDHPSTSSPPGSKRIRCGSPSPVRFSPFSPVSRSDKLAELFPLVDRQVLDKVLRECGDDIDVAVKRVQELYSGASEENACSSNNVEAHPELDEQPAFAVKDNSSTLNNLPADGAQWVDSFVSEMQSATSVDDARARAARGLEALQKSICARTGAETESLRQENMILKEQNVALTDQNNTLKYGVRNLFERQKEAEQEVQQLKLQVSKLEMTNYTLQMHLNQAQQWNPVNHGRYPPDVF